VSDRGTGTLEAIELVLRLSVGRRELTRLPKFLDQPLILSRARANTPVEIRFGGRNDQYNNFRWMGPIFNTPFGLDCTYAWWNNRFPA